MITVLEDYAAETVSDVHDEFAYLHGMLQIAENKILDSFEMKLQRFVDKGHDKA
jgi:hypothetical protein